MARIRIVMRRKPMIEAVIVRLWLCRLVEFAIHVPFAHVAGRIARLLQQFRDRDLALPHMHWRIFRDPVTHAHTRRCAPRHQRCA